MNNMQLYLKILVLSLLTSLLVVSCGTDPGSVDNPVTPQQKESFMRKTALGVFKGSSEEYVFKTNLHQCYYTGDGIRFFITANDFSSNMLCEYSAMPTATSSGLSANVLYGQTRLTLNLNAVKSDDNYVWLWDENQGYGIVTPLI